MGTEVRQCAGCGVKSRGSCWKRRLSGLWPKQGGVERSSKLLLRIKPFASSQLIVVHGEYSGLLKAN